MTRKKKTHIAVFLSLILFTLMSCKSNTSRIELKDTLLFCETSPYTSLHEVQRNKDFIKLTKEAAENLSNLLVNEKNYIWIKSTFTIDKSLKYKDLALYIAFLRSADEVYFNGNLIGTYGDFPPNEFSAGFKAHYYPIHKDLINKEGENTILIKVCAVSMVTRTMFQPATISAVPVGISTL